MLELMNLELSCEMLAKEILKEFDCVYVSVFEDNENGAEIYTPDHIYNFDR
jgi:hypothetical protein